MQYYAVLSRSCFEVERSESELDENSSSFFIILLVDFTTLASLVLRSFFALVYFTNINNINNINKLEMIRRVLKSFLMNLV